MATFECKVYKLTIEEHPNADKLELAVVGDYRSIVMKGQFKTGDLGVYIPEGAVCPDWLIAKLGLEGKLAGPQHNRVKAVRLRGVVSQGLIYPVILEPDAYCLNLEGTGYMEVAIGWDVAEYLGITKYEPPIPVHMSGEVFNAFGMTLKYDIENYKLHPTVFEDGERVVMTEKIHGTWCCFGWHPDLVDHKVNYLVTSKGLSGDGLAFKFNEANENNLYIRALHSTNIGETNVIDRLKYYFKDGLPCYILGEVYGQGVQDLQYGSNAPAFRVFDIYRGYPGQGSYMNAFALKNICKEIEVAMVPELYRGDFSKEIMMEMTSGKETVSGEEVNMREGIVIRPFTERYDVMLGRVILKSVSTEYLLRKGGTEFN